MAIRAPGFAAGRIFTAGPGKRRPRAFPSFAVPPAKARPIALNLTSMIDVLVVTLVFLLFTFSASDACGCKKNIEIPTADNPVEMIEAPFISVTPGQILLDGSVVGQTRAIIDAHRVTRIEDLFDHLKTKRENWRTLNPGRDFPGNVVFEIDGDVPTSVVKSVALTATLSGYPNFSFMVRKDG